MNSDCGFRIGLTHTVCQDYATARSGERSYALLADGCSSSPDTDIGARLLVKSVESLLPQLAIDAESDGGTRMDAFLQEAIRKAQSVSRLLELDDRALDATLLTAIAQGDLWQMAIVGDGVLARQDREGNMHIVSVSFPGGYPCYLNYSLDADRQRGYNALPDTHRKCESFVMKADGSMEMPETVEETEYSPCFLWQGACADTRWIAIMSDGVHSVAQAADSETSRASTTIDCREVLRDLLAFKNTNGVFVQRRLQRFARQWEAEGRNHRDDLSLAAIAFGG